VTEENGSGQFGFLKLELIGALPLLVNDLMKEPGSRKDEEHGKRRESRSSKGEQKKKWKSANNQLKTCKDRPDTEAKWSQTTIGIRTCSRCVVVG
jgi:hypothetical protein